MEMDVDREFYFILGGGGSTSPPGGGCQFLSIFLNSKPLFEIIQCLLGRIRK